MLVVRRQGQENTTKECVVDRQRVAKLAEWAVANNPEWRKLGCRFSAGNAELLPLNGVPDDLPTHEEAEGGIQDDANGPDVPISGKYRRCFFLVILM
jgi:hypothetical protein